MHVITPNTLRAFARCAFAVVSVACVSVANASQAVLCHYTYGGETRTLTAAPVASPHGVEPVAVGSYFQLRVVFQNRPADVAGIKIYTYADREPSPVIIHQASYPFPPRTQGHKSQKGRGLPYGFTGQQIVYEPVRDGELEYWCEWKARTSIKVAP